MQRILILSTLVLSACSSTHQLSTKARTLDVLPKAGPQCEVVGKVVGEHDEGSVDLARNHARNQAADLGADSIVYGQIVSNAKEFRVHATAYRCQNEE